MIYTVCGKIEPTKMGITLGHEHFKWEYDWKKALLRYESKENNMDEDEQSFHTIMPILKDLKQHGCQCVVEASPPFGGENPKLLYHLSKASNLHIIANTGWNLDKSTFDPNDGMFVEGLANQWINDFICGMDTVENQSIQPGYIKLLLDKGKLSEIDKSMLLAATIASKKTGMPIHCHILEAEMVYDVIALLDEVSFDYNKFLWAHTDRESNLEVIAFAIKKGMWLGLDQIRVGTEKEKCKLLMEIIKRGAYDKVILSQDYDFYEEAMTDLLKHPCAYLFQCFLPYCIEQGVNPDLLMRILRDNPSRFYNIDT